MFKFSDISFYFIPPLQSRFTLFHYSSLYITYYFSIQQSLFPPHIRAKKDIASTLFHFDLHILTLILLYSTTLLQSRSFRHCTAWWPPNIIRIGIGLPSTHSHTHSFFIQKGYSLPHTFRFGLWCFVGFQSYRHCKHIIFWTPPRGVEFQNSFIKFFIIRFFIGWLY